MTDGPQEAPKSMRARSDEAHDTDLLATLNARTARRQRLAIGGIGAVLLAVRQRTNALLNQHNAKRH